MLKEKLVQLTNLYTSALLVNLQARMKPASVRAAALLVYVVCRLAAAFGLHGEDAAGARSLLRGGGPLERFTIAPHYDATFSSLGEGEQRVIKDVLLEGAIRWLGDVLQVRPLGAAIQLDRTCTHPGLYYVVRGERYCKENCKPVTRCGPVAVPAEHLKPCKRCTDNGRKCDSGEGVRSEGVMEGHFILYVSAIYETHCRKSSFSLSASHCHQGEAEFDRPTAGYINFCPGKVSLDPSHVNIQLLLVLRELLHALAFSKELIPYFHNEEGYPRTERTSTGGVPRYQDGTYAVDPNTIQSVRRSRWTVVSPDVYHLATRIVTPNVQREVRSHFNCSSLLGAELENWRSEKNPRLLWEKRVFGDELMTTSLSSKPVVSRITLGLLEDSGWYVPDYSYGEVLHWGHNAGCSFVNDSCGGWMEWAWQHEEVPLSPFCDVEDHREGREGCVAQRTGVGECLIRNYSLPLPRDYQYLSQKVGGTSPVLDYCPAYVKLEYRGHRIGRSCLNPDHAPLEHSLEMYSPSSRCFDLVDTHLTSPSSLLSPEGGSGSGSGSGSGEGVESVVSSRRHSVGCYQFRCSRQRVTITIGNQEIRCRQKGQKKKVDANQDGVTFSGFVVCPEYSEVCAEFDCLNGCSGHGSCDLGVCHCNPGYYGNDCSWSYSQKLLNCSQVRCQNGGHCSNSEGSSFSCECPLNFTGSLCEREVVPDPCEGVTCSGNGVCARTKMWRSHECVCYPGWSGGDCSTVEDMCSTAGRPCVNGTCQRNTTMCVCDRLYIGERCDIRNDVCLRTMPCRNGATCTTDWEGDTYTCTCPEGYMGSQCELVDPCHGSSPCQNSGNCTAISDGSHRCQCPSGFIGGSCEHRDHCVDSPCENGGTCSTDTTQGTFVCACARGWKGGRCRNRANPCRPNPCVNGGRCKKDEEGPHGSIVCKCTEGFEGEYCEVTH